MRVLQMAVVACVLFTASVRADDAADRERRAKAALALAGAKSKAVAPAPHLAPAKTFSEGYTEAVKANKPLVVFVGCAGHAGHSTGMIPSVRVDSFAGISGPAAVIAYPVGDTLYEHKRIPCPFTEEQLSSAVRAASNKIAGPTSKDAPVPKPLKWDF